MLQINNDRFFPFFFMLIPFTWAGSFIAGKYVIAEIDPLGSVFLRFIFSALFMLPGLIIWHRKRQPKFREQGFVKHLSIVVLTSGIGYHVLFFWALKYTSPTNTAIIIALNPFFTAFAEILWFKSKRSGRFYLGFLLAFAGALWVNLSRGDGYTLSKPGLGEALCLGASILWSVYTLAAKSTKKPHWDALWINAYNYLFTALLLLPLALKWIDPYVLAGLSAEVWAGILYMAIFPTAIGYTLFYIGVQKKGPAWAATFIYLVPSLTAILDFAFFRAQFTLAMTAGTLFVVLGLMTGNLNRRQIETLKTVMGYKNNGRN